MILYAHITYVYIIYHKSFAFIAIKSVYIIIITFTHTISHAYIIHIWWPWVSMKTLTACLHQTFSSHPSKLIFLFGNYSCCCFLFLLIFFSFHTLINFNEAQPIWNNTSSSSSSTLRRTIITCESLQTKQLLYTICM